MEDVILMSVHLTDNAAVDFVKTAVLSYVSTMKQLVQNTMTELYPDSSSAHSLTSQDMLVLVTAFCSLLGLFVSLGAVYTVCKFVLWICIGQPASGRRKCYYLYNFYSNLLTFFGAALSTSYFV